MAEWFQDALSNWDTGRSWQDDAPQYQPPQQQPWFTNTQSESQDGWWDDVWGWATSDSGLSVLGGVADGLYQAYQNEKMYDRGKAASGGGGGGGPSAAELQDARIRKHNESINKPMDMGMRKLKR